jgi:hypothetical protein
MSFIHSTTAKFAMVGVAAAATIVGVSSTASAASSEVVSICPQGSQWAELWFEAANVQTIGGPWTQPGTCTSIVVPDDGSEGWAMHVEVGNNGNNTDLGVAAFVYPGSSDYHIYTYDTNPRFAIYAV